MHPACTEWQKVSLLLDVGSIILNLADTLQGVSCVMRLHRLLTVNLSARHYQDEIRNRYPFPEAKVALGNVEVSFPRGNFGPSKVKSEIITQSGMRLRNGEEISVTKKRKFTICELQITYHFELAFSRPRVGYTSNWKGKMPRAGMSQRRQLRTPREGEKKTAGKLGCGQRYCY